MNVLAIGAHYDDIELGCGGSLVKHVKNNDNVLMFVLTDSAYNDYNGAVLRTKEIASEEGRQAASILGINDLICNGLTTKRVEYNVDLIEKINRIIDERNIDTIYTHWVHDIHQDHSAIGRATINAGRHVPRILMYRSNWYASAIQFHPTFYVDISEFMQIKIESIKAHKTEYNKFGEKWIDFVKHQNRNSGIEIEVEYAESFELIKYLM